MIGLEVLLGHAERVSRPLQGEIGLAQILIAIERSDSGGDRFVQVDKSLLMLCGELDVITQPLRTLLEVIAS